MADIKELFAGGSLSCEEFTEKLAESGLVILDGCEEDYVSAGRVAELQSMLQNAEAEYEAKLAKQRASSALTMELAKNGAMNPALAASVIGFDDICGSDEEVKHAAEEKVKLLMKSEPYMFAGRSEPTFSTGSAHTGSVVDTDSMSDSEYYSYRKTI